MIDAIRVNAHNIPRTAPKVAGYVTGTADIQWTAAQWASFPRSGHVRIDQSPGLASFAAGAAERWSTIYGTESTIASAAAELQAAGSHGWYYGHVDCWLADWNLDEAQAAALVGREIHGFSCRAVQWASPSSNPGTIVPGGTLSLAQAQVDLSVAADTWHPAPGSLPA